MRITLQPSMPILLASVLSKVLFPAPGGPSNNVMRPGLIVPLMLSRITNLCLLFLRSPVNATRDYTVQCMWGNDWHIMLSYRKCCCPLMIIIHHAHFQIYQSWFLLYWIESIVILATKPHKSCKSPQGIQGARYWHTAYIYSDVARIRSKPLLSSVNIF